MHIRLSCQPTRTVASVLCVPSPAFRLVIIRPKMRKHTLPVCLQAYSLFAACDGTNDLQACLWQACNVISTASAQKRSGSPFNPAEDPRFDSFSPKAGSLPVSQLRALRGVISNTSSLAPAAGSFLASLGDPFGSSFLQQHDISDTRGFLELGAPMYAVDTVTGQPYKPCLPSDDQQIGLINGPQDVTYQQLCGAPEHARLGLSSLACADPPRSPLPPPQYLAMAMHSPQPCLHSWAGAVRVSSSAPSSPADAELCSRGLFVPGQQPPPPPRACPMLPPPPPPPPRTRGSGPGTPQTPGSVWAQGFGGLPSPLQQDSFGQHRLSSPHLAPAGFSPACAHPEDLGAGSGQHDIAASVAALLSKSFSATASSTLAPKLPAARPSSVPASSSYSRLIQSAFGDSDDALCKPFGPSMLRAPPSVRLGSSAAPGPDKKPPVPDSGGKGAPAGTEDAAGALQAEFCEEYFFEEVLAPSAPLLPPTDGPVTPTAPLTILCGRPALAGSRLSRSSSNGNGSSHSSEAGSREASLGSGAPSLSRLSSSAGGSLSRKGVAPNSASAATSAPLAPTPSELSSIPSTELMYMEMHDTDCSSYCLGGNLEPHKMWFGVGVHR